MEDVRAAGKVRWIGVSSALPHIIEFMTCGAFDTFQLPYSGLERAHEDVITAAARAGGGTIIRGGVARGRRTSSAGCACDSGSAAAIPGRSGRR